MTRRDNLQLTREPGNRHDAHAIRVDWNGRQLGYRAQNQTTARLIDQRKRPEARIGGLEKRGNPWRRVAIEVWLVG